MFHRFSGSARSVVIRARDIAVSEDRKVIDPSHILFALIELHPELFEGLSTHPIDLQSVQSDIARFTTPRAEHRLIKPRFSEQSKRVLQGATSEARSCWEQWEAPRRRQGQLLIEDQNYWEARLKKPLRMERFPQWMVRWILRRRWEVDERHLLLGLLNQTEYPGIAVLAKQGVTLETARQRLCATRG
jgi:ATP-dependent Clp protease ATP-binding subunit ClpA